METLQALTRHGLEDRRYPEEYISGDDTPFDGLAVTEEEYWETYYNHPGEYIYELKNGHLEAKAVSDHKGSRTCRWFTDILSCYMRTHKAGEITNLEIGFRLNIPGQTNIRRPDLAVILNDNPVAINDDDCTYNGVFDLCVESLSYSSEEDIERDTKSKKEEYQGTGVTEYYILDARKIETVFYRLDRNGKYRKIRQAKGGIIRSAALPGFQFRIPDLYTQPPLEELAEDPLYRDYVFPSYREVRKELAEERKRTEKEKRRAEKAEKKLAAEKQRAEKELAAEKRRAEKEMAAEKRRAEKRLLRAALAMLAAGMDTADVMKHTALSVEAVTVLKSGMRQNL